MDWLTFIAELSKALAWPLAAVVIACIFRNQLKQLLGRVRKGKLGPAEFEFEESVRALKSEATEFSKAPAPELPRNERKELTKDPRATIITSWLEVEDSMRALLRAKRFSPSAIASPLRTIQAVRGLGLVDNVYVDFTEELRELRNRATHEQDFSPSDKSVLDYVLLAKELSMIYRAAAEA